MTEKTVIICDDCGERIENEDKAVGKYRKRHPNNETVLDKEHYHPSCEIPEGDEYYDIHPFWEVEP